MLLVCFLISVNSINYSSLPQLACKYSHFSDQCSVCEYFFFVLSIVFPLAHARLYEEL